MRRTSCSKIIKYKAQYINKAFEAVPSGYVNDSKILRKCTNKYFKRTGNLTYVITRNLLSKNMTKYLKRINQQSQVRC